MPCRKLGNCIAQLGLWPVPVQCQKSASSMMMGIGTPKSQSRMPLPMIFLLMWFGAVRAIVPDAIAQRAALSGKAPNKAQKSATTRMQRVSSATERVEPGPRRLKCEDGRGQWFGAGNRSYCTVLSHSSMSLRARSLARPGVGRPLANVRNAQEVPAWRPRHLAPACVRSFI